MELAAQAPRTNPLHFALCTALLQAAQLIAQFFVKVTVKHCESV